VGREPGKLLGKKVSSKKKKLVHGYEGTKPGLIRNNKQDLIQKNVVPGFSSAKMKAPVLQSGVYGEHWTGGLAQRFVVLLEEKPRVRRKKLTKWGKRGGHNSTEEILGVCELDQGKRGVRWGGLAKK